MADYDGPLYSIAVTTFTNDPATNNEVVLWTTAPTIVPITGFGSGGGGPVTPEGDPIYGYGWGLSG